MWAILRIGLRAFWLWWTRCYGMILRWGIDTSESFFIGYAAILFDTSHWGTPFLVEGLFFRWPLCRGILLSVNDGFIVMAIPWRISDSIFFFHIGAWDMIGIFIWCILLKGIPLLVDDGFWGIAVPWRRLDSFHIGVWDMIGWFLWYDHESIAFSLLLTYFWDDWIRTRTQTLMRACSGA